MIILFDSICNLCSASVKFIIKRDKHAVFKFVPFQSDTGKQLLKQNQIDIFSAQTLILIKNYTIYCKSDAVLEISKHLSGIWKLADIFKIIPRIIRDFIYDSISKYRYAWFGKKAECMLPDDEIKSRFLE